MKRLFRSVDPCAFAVLLGAFVVLAGCATPVASGSTGLPVGINDAFLSKDLDVEKYVERFEGESRAVYSERTAIVGSLGLEKGDRIADIGAGTGFFAALFDEAVGEDGRVFAVEISPKFLEHLRERAKDEGLGAVRVVEGTERSVELAPNSVDVAFVCDVYHHFAYPMETLASLMSAIRPGGELVVIDFERIPGESPEWLLEHVRAGREVFREEIETAGFTFANEIRLAHMEGNYILRFRRPK